MLLTMLKSKLHRARVTDADINYEGSIGIDKELCEKADLKEFEKVEIYNVTNGNRFATYVIYADKGTISLNGAAARLVAIGDIIIIASYSHYTPEEAENHKPILLLMDENNKIKGTAR